MATANESTDTQQKNRAWWLFLVLVLVFGVSLYFLLAVQYQYWPLNNLAALVTDKPTPVNQLTPEQTEQIKKLLKTFEPLQWVLASLIGAALYLLGQIAVNYPKINEKPEADNQNDFIKSTYWYIITLIRAPILTVVIMWLLMNLKIDMGAGEKVGDLGIAVDFSKFDALVKVGIAFILGFYGRVARKQLDIIAKYLFTSAWTLAEMGFEVAVSSPDVMLLNDTYTFKTDPVMDVVWTANIGTMEAGTGTYKSPDDVNDDGKSVVVRAYLKGEPSSTQFKEIKLKLFKITGNTTVNPASVIPLKLEKRIEKIGEDAINLDGAVWDCDDSKGTFDKNKKGSSINFTAPDLDGAEEKTVTIFAIYKHVDEKEYKAEFKVKIAKPQ